jgi:phenylalanyl-tRNA synthetase alpha chain
MMLERIDRIRDEARAAIAAADDAAAVEEARVRFLGRKAELTTILRGIGELPPEQRGPVGKAGNDVRTELEALLEEARGRHERAELDDRLAAERIDVTLPGTPPVRLGHLHPLTRTRREIEDIFAGLGYRVTEGPEVEHDYYNFTALNYPPGHPARMLQDTFYVDPASLGADPALVGSDGEPLIVPPGPRDVLLRTHTSPMQIRGMEDQEPPIFIVVPGRVYRRDSDATHTPMFNQVEGLAVGEDITLADLHGTLLTFARAIFGAEREVRIRPHFFPFTEPSAEVDVGWSMEKGRRVVGGSEGWMEVLGSGMVHPKVIAACGLDPGEWQGFAFGTGVDRLAMLKYGMDDLRAFFDGDLRWLKHYGFRALDVPTLSGGVGA